MCLIIYSKNGDPVDRTVFDYARTTNPDGIGVMSIDGVAKFLGRKHGKRAWRYLSQLSGAGIPFAVHFRWRTHGDISRRNTPPYTVPGRDVHIMHNGILSQYAAKAGAATGLSDTALFVESEHMRAFPNLDAPARELSRWVDDTELHISYGNKLAILDLEAGGMFQLVNEDEGFWSADGGIWYSNTYSVPDSAIPYRTRMAELRARSRWRRTSSTSYGRNYDEFTGEYIGPGWLSAYDAAAAKVVKRAELGEGETMKAKMLTGPSAKVPGPSGPMVDFSVKMPDDPGPAGDPWDDGYTAEEREYLDYMTDREAVREFEAGEVFSDRRMPRHA